MWDDSEFEGFFVLTLLSHKPVLERTIDDGSLIVALLDALSVDGGDVAEETRLKRLFSSLTKVEDLTCMRKQADLTTATGFVQLLFYPGYRQSIKITTTIRG